jgi:hypothetical protein
MASINILVSQLKAIPISDWSAQVEMLRQTSKVAHTATTTALTNASNAQDTDALEEHLNVAKE